MATRRSSSSTAAQAQKRRHPTRATSTGRWSRTWYTYALASCPMVSQESSSLRPRQVMARLSGEGGGCPRPPPSAATSSASDRGATTARSRLRGRLRTPGRSAGRDRRGRARGSAPPWPCRPRSGAWWRDGWSTGGPPSGRGCRRLRPPGIVGVVHRVGVEGAPQRPPLCSPRGHRARLESGRCGLARCWSGLSALAEQWRCGSRSRSASASASSARAAFPVDRLGLGPQRRGGGHRRHLAQVKIYDGYPVEGSTYPVPTSTSLTLPMAAASRSPWTTPAR
jgi:hypothetical protein